jgi:hypothetical protein
LKFQISIQNFFGGVPRKKSSEYTEPGLNGTSPIPSSLKAQTTSSRSQDGKIASNRSTIKLQI